MSHSLRYVLFGAGAAGRYTLAHLALHGIHPVAFADNDALKWGTPIDGVPVMSPSAARSLAPDAFWVATCISAPARAIRKEMRDMLVKSLPLHEVLPCHHGIPPNKIRDTLFPAIYDTDSKMEFNDQCVFRRDKNYEYQLKPSSCDDLYFPSFIKRLDDEVFIDCGAADGDTIREFLKRWPKFKSIVAFEPDHHNWSKLISTSDSERGNITKLRMAVGDHAGEMSFTANGDYSSHLGEGEEKVRVVTLDNMLGDILPTYIKADVEGFELELLWGARKKIKEHSPVLAVCAYHTSDHLWQIPLLIHAINPDYKLFLRRYAEGAWETVWYAVPPERIK